MFASHHGLDNLNLIIDNNKISMLGYTDDIISHGSILSRLAAFGWDAVEVDGHNVSEVHEVIERQKNTARGKPGPKKEVTWPRQAGLSQSSAVSAATVDLTVTALPHTLRDPPKARRPRVQLYPHHSTGGCPECPCSPLE